MRGTIILTVGLALCAVSSVTAQTVIKILQFEKNTGIIDRGEQDGIHVGDVFEVNRYADDYVYWVGRVEVIVVKPKVSGVKLLEKAVNSAILKGDVLELRKREYDPLLDKLNQSADDQSGPAKESAQKAKNDDASRDGVRGPSVSTGTLSFGVTTGLLQTLTRSSESFGQNQSIEIRTQDGRLIRTISLSHAFATSLAFQAFCALPWSGSFSVSLHFAYVPLNLNSEVESDFLDARSKASGSLMKINGSLNYRFNQRLHLGVGAGLFLPQVTVTGRYRPSTISDRHFGFAADVAYYLPLGSRVWLKSMLEYNVFLDDGPAIQSLAFQAGPSFAIGRR
jgi:hypothetical protein